ncbi:MAG: SufD family Fe-S cluster assembly protein [Methanophagales archaeon]|nr:SufD family Fe-S cluster assembly protein [Methanophagales archaeon]
MKREEVGEVEGAENEKQLVEFPDEHKERLLMSGVDLSGKERSGSFIQKDTQILLALARHAGLEVMPIAEALETHEWLAEYFWKAVPADADAYTKATHREKEVKGVFVRAKRGVKIPFPVQACFFIASEHTAQKVHNIIIAEEDAELHLITGCATPEKFRSAVHIGVSEFYVGKNAKMSFAMIHNWSSDVGVRPRSAAIVEENGTFISNYVCMEPAKSIQMYPTAFCVGENALATFQSILYGRGDAKIDVGSKAVLAAKGSRAEIISRAVATENAEITARGEIVGNSAGVKGHLECRGLLLSSSAKIHAIPALRASHSDVELSHEAAVGKIAEEEVRYLMARGLSEEEATSFIIRGFLSIDIKGLPPKLASQVQRMMQLSAEKLL